MVRVYDPGLRRWTYLPTNAFADMALKELFTEEVEV